jgi:hypothetical protein
MSKDTSLPDDITDLPAEDQTIALTAGAPIATTVMSARSRSRAGVYRE